MKKLIKAVIWFLLGCVVSGIASYHMAIKQYGELTYDVETVTRVLNPVFEKEPSFDKVVKAISNSGINISEKDSQSGIIVLEPRVNSLGIGGRWIIECAKSSTGSVQRYSLTLQPVGYP